ncbi:periplasmic solute binding protein [Desulfatibacillum aliphaticivorans]|uniref:Periplasmic solute binding protein n=1 Tax=Desulfatibacillum aliphaticivorans TaxID=218208 RepID=B8FAF3_DESAL|nr:zinc ABC transporter substrate-binding protein [Desulfatibacillum aliphaticivorans]ACL03249.1 periplasmic solute binding protein [Desulfatibacillum aliphaticivorans]
MKILFRMLVFFCVLGLWAPGAFAGDAPMPVYVSISPQAFFVGQIGGDRVSVDVLIPPGKSPAVYSPTPAQMSGLAKAKVFFRIGVPFENALMPKIKTAAPNTLVVDTRQGIRLRTMSGHHHHEGEEEHHDMEEHGDEGEEHRHDADEHDGDHHGESLDDHARGKDPHIWLDPNLVKIQAKTICHALIDLDPEGKAFYEANLEGFLKGLDGLDREIAEALKPVKGSTVFVFHPSYGYLCDAYGLKQLAVELEGKTPKGKELAQFIAKAKKDNVRVIFVQPQFDKNAAENIARSINGAVLSLNPLARDYFANMKSMATAISQALSQ